MTSPNFLSDEAVEEEIARLMASPYVKLAQREHRIRYARRQYMYNLRALEKRGRQLQADGITMETLDVLARGIEPEEEGGS